MAIQQKLTLTQRLEDLEMDRERQTFKRTMKYPQQSRDNVKAVRYPPSKDGSGNFPRNNNANNPK